LSVQCVHYSKENKGCRFSYTPNPLISILDIIPQCDGYKNHSECCWYRPYLNIFHKGGYP